LGQNLDLYQIVIAVRSAYFSMSSFLESYKFYITEIQQHIHVAASRILDTRFKVCGICVHVLIM